MQQLQRPEQGGLDGPWEDLPSLALLATDTLKPFKPESL